MKKGIKLDKKMNKPEKEEIIQEDNNKINRYHSSLWYLIIFSILGLIIETLYCYATTGIWESRKGLILGPVCPVYGVGALAIILILNKYKGHKVKLFCYGAIVGSVLEYIISYVLEAMYGTRFWDYSYLKINLNGRIALEFAIFWGILTWFIIDIVKPIIDKFINKIKGKKRVVLDVLLTELIVLDIILTVWGINVYKTRAKKEHEEYVIDYEEKEENFIEKIENTLFSNEIMSTIFPNLRYVDKDLNTVWIKDILK